MKTLRPLAVTCTALLLLATPYAEAQTSVTTEKRSASTSSKPGEADLAPRSNVRDFGAVGDGVADDTGAIETAVQTGSVYFPKGTYRLTRTIRIELEKTGFAALTSDGTARIVMGAAGPAFHFLGTHAGSADPASFQPEVWLHQRAPIVDHLEIIGEHAEADGIEATGTMQLTITGTSIRAVRHAIHLTGRNRNVLISHCHLYQNRGCGVLFDGVNLHQTNIAGSHISYNAGGGIVTRGGEIRNLHIGACDIESNMTPTAPASANVLIDCTGGSTAEVAITGCTLQHNSKSPGSANIRFLGAGIMTPKRTEPTQEGHLVVSGNVLSDVMVNIHLQQVRGATITGNTFWQGFEHDLLIEGGHAVVIGPNDFDRNPRYGANARATQDRGGIVLRDCVDTKLTGILLKGVWSQPAALALENCTRCTVQDCSIVDSDGVGLALVESKDCLVSGNVIRDDRAEKKATFSLQVRGGTGHWIHANCFGQAVEGLSESDRRENRSPATAGASAPAPGPATAPAKP